VEFLFFAYAGGHLDSRSFWQAKTTDKRISVKSDNLFNFASGKIGEI